VIGPDLEDAAKALHVALAQATAGETQQAAQALRAEPGSTWTEPLTGIRFLWIPGGRFQMGGTEYEREQPIHWVRVSPFWLGETPVTNRQYAAFLEQTDREEPRTWRDKRFCAPEQPVVSVSWENAMAFCRWLSELSGREVTLPSEAQWEFAARGTDGREYPWGAEPPDATRAYFGLNWQTDQPASVGSYPAGKGPFGTLDQAGNVWEWCLDVWDEKAYAKRAKREEVDPVAKGKGDDRALRGGGWVSPALYLRAAYRYRLPARSRSDVIGFRVAAAPASISNP
jgi:formylglycine-generating enzyme required for sulfatase activity